MLCPTDNTEMREVKILSHYGGPIFVDQCDKCGGIWFDETDLFRAGQGEAERVEVVNIEMLQTPSAVGNCALVCPKDQGAMDRFTDKYFPEDIVLLRCRVCHGIWLNRGIFTRYQRYREKSMRPKKTTQHTEANAQRQAWHEDELSAGTRGRIAEFLSTPVELYRRPFDPSGIGSIADDIADFLAKTITGLLFPGWKE